MTPEERQLLGALADRIRSTPVQAHDAEADQVLAQLYAQKPETIYLLAQTVLMQDFALRNAQAQITQLQQQLTAAQAQTQPADGGGFLRGIFGSHAQPQPQPLSQPAPQPSPWSRPAAAPQQAYYPAQPAYQPVVMQPSQTSSFLRDAATTAAGVAGGALLFQGIESLFGAHQGFGGGFAGGGFGGGMPMESLTETTIINNNTTVVENNDGYDAGPQDPGSADDASYQDTTDDSSGDGSDGGGDWT